MRAHEQELWRRIACEDLPGRLDAVHSRQHDVHENEAGCERLDLRNRLHAVRGLAYDVPRGVRPKHRENGSTPRFVVVHDQHAAREHVGGRNHLSDLASVASPGSRTRARIVVPRPGCDSMARSPSTSLIRSSMLTSPIPCPALARSTSKPAPRSLTTR